MKTVVPANPIKVFMRHGEIGDGEYLCSNVAFMIVDDDPNCPDLGFVTISGTCISAREVAFAKVLIDGVWVSHD